MSQVHKRFTSDQVKELLDRYLKNEVERNYLQEILGIKKRRFFALLKQYREDPQRFTIQYERRIPSRNLSTWTHIQALQTVFLRYGLPFAYYVDSHSIFRFVQGRDSLWRKHYLLTDGATPQWKQVLGDCNVKVTHALSPQAKGKIERPYGWLQDHLIRTCVREDIADIKPAQQILREEVHRYNYRQVHSTTQEVPYFRFQRALKEKRSLFREFKTPPPFQSPKDIFCLRMDRIADAYRQISISSLQFKIHADPMKQINLQIHPLDDQISEIRFWCEGKLLDIQKVKNSDLKGVHS